jgi:WD40 repeat protein/serine/threonine protein kinase
MLKQIRGYIDLRLIGTGGFGEVYVGRQEVINREVAIKVILPVHANRADFIQRFKFEAELIARLEHPHIVPLYDYWRDPDGAFLIMRYIRGGSLADKLMQGPLDIHTAARLLDQIAGALFVAHRNKIIHQDIKPANILLDEDGNAYLTDFGIARDIESNVNLAQDADNTMHGSPKYISPEHLRRKEITHRSDIYSLGILMYEVLTGHPPFDSTEMLQLLQHHVRTPMPSLQEKKPDLPPELNQPIQQATIKDPMSRYENVTDFARDFQMIVTRLQYPTLGTTTIGIPAGGIGMDATGAIEVFNPYKGLKAFQESDASDFYGRESLVQSLMTRMVEFHPLQRFLAVVGPSGSGKSSVVRAGLLPAIRRGDVQGLPILYMTDMIPGNDPIRKLEGAILKVAHRATVELMETLSKETYNLNEMLKIALPANGEMLLIIDQFEEVFTLVNNEDRRRNFLNLIYQAVMAEDSRLRLIVTMRADFLDRPLDYAGWGDLLRERMELVAPMKPSELRDAIEKPATVAGLSLEDGLTDRVINDVSAQVGALPLLQYTLSELYERREGIELSIAAYQELGGVSGALAQRAEEIFEVLTPIQREATRLFFPRLIRLGLGRDSTRRRVLLSELYSLRTDTEAIKNALDAFGRYRLLTNDYDINSRLPTVEVAHEALIRSWHRLQGWLRDNEDALRLQERLSVEVEQWEEAKEDFSFLPSGLRLEQYKTLINHETAVLTNREQGFLDEAIELENQHELARHRRQQVFRALTAAIFVFGIIASILAVVAYQARNDEAVARADAEDARDLQATARADADISAQAARARELAASSLLFADTFPDRAMLLGLESLGVVDTFEGRNALMTSLLTQWRVRGYFNGNEAFVRELISSPDGTLLVSGSANGTVIIWNTDTHRVIQMLKGHNAIINGIVFSPDGKSLISADADGNLIVWDTATWEQSSTLKIETSTLRALAFSPDGRWLVAATAEGRLQLWNGSDFSEVQTLEGHNGTTIYDVAFSPNSTVMVSGGEDGTLHYWNTETFELIRVVPAHEEWVLSLDFSPDGTKLVSGGLDQSVRLWDVASGNNIWAIRAHSAEVRAVTFSDDDRFVISGDLKARIVIWDISNPNNPTAFSNITQTAVRAFATIDNMLYVAGDNQQIYELSIGFEPRFGTYLVQNADEIWSVAISPSAKQIAYAGGSTGGGALEDYAVYIWDNENSELSRLPIIHTLPVSDLLFRGEQLISVGLDRRIVVWEGDIVSREIFASDGIVSAAIHDNILALGLNNGNIELLDLSSESDTPFAVLQKHSERVTDLAFDSAGQRLISGSRDRQVIIWDIETQSPLLAPLTGHRDVVESVAISPDGRMIASGGRDTNIILWDALTGEQLGPPLSEHEDWVMGLAFNADGSLLASASADRSILLWDVASQRLLGKPFFGHSALISSLDFSADGKFMVSVGTDGSVMRWQANLEDWQTRACSVANRSLTEAEVRDYFNNVFPPSVVCGD